MIWVYISGQSHETSELPGSDGSDVESEDGDAPSVQVSSIMYGINLSLLTVPSGYWDPWIGQPIPQQPQPISTTWHPWP